MSNWQTDDGDWACFQNLPNTREVDFHPPPRAFRDEDDYMPYWARMNEVYARTLEALESAYEDGIDWVIFRHGYSTSRRGKTTSRSVVRSVMRSTESTPYIVRKKCIQHYSVFVAAIKPNPEGRAKKIRWYREQIEQLRLELLGLLKRTANDYYRESATKGLHILILQRDIH